MNTFLFLSVLATCGSVFAQQQDLVTYTIYSTVNRVNTLKIEVGIYNWSTGEWVNSWNGTDDNVYMGGGVAYNPTTSIAYVPCFHSSTQINSVCSVDLVTQKVSDSAFYELNHTLNGLKYDSGLDRLYFLQTVLSEDGSKMQSIGIQYLNASVDVVLDFNDYGVITWTLDSYAHVLHVLTTRWDGNGSPRYVQIDVVTLPFTVISNITLDDSVQVFAYSDDLATLYVGYNDADGAGCYLGTMDTYTGELTQILTLDENFLIPGNAGQNGYSGTRYSNLFIILNDEGQNYMTLVNLTSIEVVHKTAYTKDFVGGIGFLFSNYVQPDLITAQ